MYIICITKLENINTENNNRMRTISLKSSLFAITNLQNNRIVSLKFLIFFKWKDIAYYLFNHNFFLYPLFLIRGLCFSLCYTHISYLWDLWIRGPYGKEGKPLINGKQSESPLVQSKYIGPVFCFDNWDRLGSRQIEEQ